MEAFLIGWTSGGVILSTPLMTYFRQYFMVEQIIPAFGFITGLSYAGLALIYSVES